jgi:uncharacterized protein (DUF608 family)
MYPSWTALRKNGNFLCWIISKTFYFYTMIIYNVTLKVDNDIADAWVQWMNSEHIPDVMSTGLFSGHRLSRLLQQDETEGVTFVAQYFCDGMEQYDKYIAEYAETMRNKAFSMFGGRFAAFRTVMETVG